MIQTGPPPRGDGAFSPARRLSPADAAVFETHVVPRYLSLFGDRMLDMIAEGRDARVCHVHCRTGYPDRELLAKLPNAHVFGCDASEHAIALARAKAQATPGFLTDYRVVAGTTMPFPAGAFSHAFTLHPLAAPSERKLLVEELARIVAPRGQALIAIPLRGSFVEIADLLRECALKRELPDLSDAVEAAMQVRPTEDQLVHELEAVGFEFIETDVRKRTLTFESGRDFFDDPVTRLLLLPEFRVNLALREDRTDDAPLDYVREAIDKYWSDGGFDLGFDVGVISGRRPA